MKYALVSYGHVVALSNDPFELVEEMQVRTKIRPHYLYLCQTGDIEYIDGNNGLVKSNYSVTKNTIKLI